jgi:predicted nucleotidyltransferase
MIGQAIREEILARLANTEREHDVRILLAVESGSRAWGFASTNSDYDVRFIYRRPADWYLAIDVEDKRDVIEYPIVDDIDCNGWDLHKALRLLWRSNPAVVEWLQSPITYLQRGRFQAEALALLPRIYSLTRGIHHYYSTAKSNYRGYLQGDRVRLKKYFYVLRPLLAVRWIEQRGSVPPMAFDELLVTVADKTQLLRDIDNLLAEKRSARETDDAPPVVGVNNFIEAELARLEQKPQLDDARHESIDVLNVLFRELIAQPWSESV